MMEDHSVSVPLCMGGSSSIIMEGIGSQMTNSLDQFGSFDRNSHNRTLDGYTVVSALRGTCTNDLHTYNRAAVVETEALGTPLEQNGARDDEFREQFVGGTHISGAADANVVASRIGLQGNLANMAVSETLMYPLETLNTCVSNDFSDGLNSSFASSMNYGCGEVFGGMNVKGHSSRVPAPLEFSAKTPVRAGFQHYSPIGNPESNSWILSNSTELRGDHSYGSCNFSKDLSLSLATSQPSAVNGTRIPDQCSEIGSSSISCRSLKESMVLSEGTKELSLSSRSYRTGHVSQLIVGSRYLQAIQEILAQIASHSLENIDQIFSTDEIRMGANLSSSSSCAREGGSRFVGPDKYSNVDNKFEAQVSPALQKRALEAKKAQLLTLLQVVDDRYNQCVDEIHTVISAFHAATELDPQIHAHFALRMISFLYKSLRERISSQILAMGAHFDGGARDAEGSAESCYFQKQWTLQQLKKKDHQLWRPQRGLPEQSVSVLRSWMFQNFLHPYPKDAEKHLLAVRSGLTRSQVSNWFINARVRLWKPMIEEMYAEMNKRKALENEDGNTNRRNHISVNNLRLKMN